MPPADPSEPETPLVESPQDTSEVTRRALDQRIRQQELLAELGVLALRGAPFTELLNQTVRIAADGLESEFCKVLEYIPSRNCLLMRAGIGWEPGLVGVATMGADLASPSGYALRTGKPVISNHLENEKRFRTPQLLAEHGVRRAMNVILGGEGEPYGVLEVDSRSEGEFGERDISFLQGAANILGMAITRQRHEAKLQAALEHQEVLLKEINHRVKNSLQVVASMLFLQAKGEKNDELANSLQQAASRVSAIARAHERLYRSTDIAQIDLAIYLSDICTDLNELSSKSPVSFKASGPVTIETDKAVRIALITTELVTNAIKYAYPGNLGGPIFVRLTQLPDKAVSVSIRDEGAGLGEDNFKKEKGFGLRICSALVEELGASLKVEQRTPGTEFIVDIPLNGRR
jgi:two-component sensor histidine kinase